MTSKESIAVILGAIALGLRNKGSKDVQPEIENITKEELVRRFGEYGQNLEENQYLHGSSVVGNIHNPILKRNPKHPAIFSEEQELETPDHGIYITKHPKYALSYNKGKENRYVSLVEVDDSNLMIDEDSLGEMTYNIVSALGAHNKHIFEMSAPKLYDNPKSPLNIILKLYDKTMDLYGHHKPKDMKYSLESLNSEIDDIEYYAEDQRKLPRIIIYLGKRMNSLMSKEERMILVKALKNGSLSLSEDDHMVHFLYQTNKAHFFIPDREEKGIKPIKVFRIID